MDHEPLLRFLPEDRVGTVQAIEPIVMGLSGAGVYGVTASRGAFILRLQGSRMASIPGADESFWTQHLLVLRRAADAGVAPPLLHVDEAARATVSQRISGMPLAAALGDPVQRQRVLASAVAQLRTLHGLDASGVRERDPLVYVRGSWAEQHVRPGFPTWAAGLDATIERIADTLARDPRRALSHNDCNPGNLLWDGQKVWLVDWDVAGVTHPLYDLATLAMFLNLDADAAAGLIALHEQRPPDETTRATFAALRHLAATLCGLTFLSLVPDLGILPAEPLALPTFYAELRSGKLDLQHPSGQAAFGVALLRTVLA
jgi:Ser/Thr protein kinase RdoA (MazF antagonist)